MGKADSSCSERANLRSFISLSLFGEYSERTAQLIFEVETMSGGRRESRSKTLGHPDMDHSRFFLIGVEAGADHAD